MEGECGISRFWLINLILNFLYRTAAVYGSLWIVLIALSFGNSGTEVFGEVDWSEAYCIELVRGCHPVGDSGTNIYKKIRTRSGKVTIDKIWFN